MAQPSATPPGGCLPSEINQYVADVRPILDQIVLASQEATQLEGLAPARIAALLESTRNIQESLSATQPPLCLQEAHLAAVNGASSLGRALESMASGEYSSAEEELRASFELTAQAAALLAILSWEPTPTAAPSP
jgi:hypothetical protein